jgi:4-hydroxy-4-methyl-2-oxoglutarate aldolase
MNLHSLIVIAVCLAASIAHSQEAADDTLRRGKSFLETKAYSIEDDRKVLAEFDGLRVADVSDGMDQAGLANRGLVSAEIGSLWKDTEHYKHRIIGIAVTARYVPTNQPHSGPMAAGDFDAWVGNWYNSRSPEPFVPLLREGSVLVIDEAEQADVTSGTARDTDEIIAEKIPLYFKQPGRGIRPGRNEIESVNRPIVVGGVLVMPGDVVVADGDGVIVVPRAVASQVAAYAHSILTGDKAARREMYKKLGLPEDDSVRE